MSIMKTQGKLEEQIKYWGNIIPEKKKKQLKKILTERGVTFEIGSKHTAGSKRKKTILISQETQLPAQHQRVYYSKQLLIVGRKTENLLQKAFEKFSKYKLFYVFNYRDLDGVEISK